MMQGLIHKSSSFFPLSPSCSNNEAVEKSGTDPQTASLANQDGARKLLWLQCLFW